MTRFELEYEYIDFDGETVSESECFHDEDAAEDRFKEILEETEDLTSLRLSYQKESGGIAYDGGIVKEFSPEVIYTGGGIWLACAYTDDRHYIVVEGEGTEDTIGEYLTCYDNTNEDHKLEPFPCQEMVWSKDLDELTDEERGQYEALKAALLREMF